MTLKLKELLDDYRHRVDQQLDKRLPAANQEPHELHQAMRYSTLNGGKRVRPFLIYATGRCLELELQQLDHAACAIELIHSYSLVHDDLPAMDDDELRRGQKTCHIQFSEATALLTGDALQTLAFELLTQAEGVNVQAKVQLVKTLAQASGSLGMAGGQAIDLGAVGQQLSLEQLKNMHQHKTGALIRAAVNMPVCIAGLSNSGEGTSLDAYAQKIGLAFQIQDDILDIESDTETLGKPQGSDHEQNKPTYPALLGLDGAKAMAQSTYQEAMAELEGFDEQADPLRWLAQYIVERKK